MTLDHDGFAVGLHDTIEEVCQLHAGADAVLIDMPVGLPESPQDLRPEPLLRQELKGRASTVFNVPCRQAVQERDYAAASRINDEVMGKRLTRQSFGILPKIREIDVFLKKEPAWKNRLLESHPEYCFAKLNQGRPIGLSKRTAEGAAERLLLLTSYYPDAPLLLTRFFELYPDARSHTDDLLDALVLALMGAAGLRNGFQSLPLSPPSDPRGILMQIIRGTLC